MSRSTGQIEAVNDDAALGMFETGARFGCSFDFPKSVEVDGENIEINIGDEVVHMTEINENTDEETEAFIVIQDQQVIVFHTDGDDIDIVTVMRKLN